MAANQKSGGGSKKYGRNKDKCARYRLQGRRYKNKVRKIKKWAGRLPKEKLDEILEAVRR